MLYLFFTTVMNSLYLMNVVENKSKAINISNSYQIPVVIKVTSNSAHLIGIMLMSCQAVRSYDSA